MEMRSKSKMGGVRSRFLLLIPRIGGNVNDHLSEKKSSQLTTDLGSKNESAIDRFDSHRK